MVKFSLVIALSFLSFCFSVAAQQTNQLRQTETITLRQQQRIAAPDTALTLAVYRPEIFGGLNWSALFHDLPVLSQKKISSVGLVGAVEGEKTNASAALRAGLPHDLVGLRLDPAYSFGEVGVFYGRSSGKFSGEEFETYIMGGVGNEKFQITAGAAYETSSIRLPRFRSFNP